MSWYQFDSIQKTYVIKEYQYYSDKAPTGLLIVVMTDGEVPILEIWFGFFV